MSPDMKIVLTITGVGMTTVFLVLVFLSYCFMALKLVAGDKEANAKDKPLPAVSAASPSEPETDAVDEDELAVVISAALAAFLGAEQQVSSIRRVEDSASWSRTGRHDQMAAAL